MPSTSEPTSIFPTETPSAIPTIEPTTQSAPLIVLTTGVDIVSTSCEPTPEVLEVVAATIADTFQTSLNAIIVYGSVCDGLTNYIQEVSFAIARKLSASQRLGARKSETEKLANTQKVITLLTLTKIDVKSSTPDATFDWSQNAIQNAVSETHPPSVH